MWIIKLTHRTNQSRLVVNDNLSLVSPIVPFWFINSYYSYMFISYEHDSIIVQSKLWRNSTQLSLWNNMKSYCSFYHFNFSFFFRKIIRIFKRVVVVGSTEWDESILSFIFYTFMRYYSEQNILQGMTGNITYAFLYNFCNLSIFMKSCTLSVALAC